MLEHGCVLRWGGGGDPVATEAVVSAAQEMRTGNGSSQSRLRNIIKYTGHIKTVHGTADTLIDARDLSGGDYPGSFDVLLD